MVKELTVKEASFANVFVSNENPTFGRVLLRIKQKNDAGIDQTIAQYVYNELGQVIDKKLHKKADSSFIQSVDYRFTIKGWLASINNAELTSNTINDDTGDYFGLELLYNTADVNLGNTALYTGNISATKWKGAGASTGTTDQKSYTFAYDKSNKLEAAAYQMFNGTNWTKEAGALNESMTYDHNGNIKTLQRSQRKHQLTGIISSYTNETIDNLTYTYNPSTGDRLTKVTDAASAPVAAIGFDNGTSSTNTDYKYDGNGNLLQDSNKGIATNGITYNVLGKPTEILYSDGRKITYVYDAGGSKLTMKTWQGATLLTTTDYVNGFVYENSVLSFFGSPEGRVVKNGSNLEYQYSISDHQGNTRIVFTSATPTLGGATASFEASTNGAFQNYPSGAGRSGLALFNNTPAGTYSQKLTGGNLSQVGVAKSMRVYPGDKVKIEAYAKYYNPSGTSSNITGFALALTGAFGVTSGSTGEALKAYNTLNNYGGIIATGGSGGSSSHPKLFVNILLFDKDHNFLDAAWEQIDGGEQVGVSPDVPHDYMSKEVTVKEAGFAYVFVSNENPTLVEFYVDDVVVTHTPTQVIQYNEYYPFGLQAATSWTRDNNTNNYLYNEGSELNKTSGWYETFFRGYDAALGRFLQVDPMSVSEMATYQYAGNNPVMFNDPWGAQKTYVDPKDVEGQRGNTVHFPDMYYNGYQDMGYSLYFSGIGGGGGLGSSINSARLSTGENWASEYSSDVTDYFLLGSKAFKQRYGVLPTDINLIWEDGGYRVEYTMIVDVELTDAQKAQGYAPYEAVVVSARSLRERKEQTQGSGPGDGRGSATSFSFGFAFIFGISGEWGSVTDETGDSKGYWTVSANFGLGLDFGFNKKEIIPTNGRFRVEQYEGKGKNLSIGAFFTGESRGGNTDDNFNGFGVDYKERSNSLSPMLVIPLSFGPGDVGVIYQLSKTSFYK